MTDPDYQIVLPWPPSTNTCYRNINGRTILSEAARAFKAKVIAAVWSNGPVPRFDQRLRVLIKLWQPTRRSVDVDNRIKPILDALVNACVMDDDSQVDELTIVRMSVLKGGACSVYIWKLT